MSAWFRRFIRHPVVLLVGTTLVVGAVAVGFVGLAWGSALTEACVVLCVLSAFALLGIPATLRAERYRRSGIEEVDEMSGVEFELRLAALYKSLGYDVVSTPASGDYGADLVLARAGRRWVVQAKRSSGSVGIDAVQEVIGARRYYDADDAVVVTNSRFTPAAAALAEADGVELTDRSSLVALLSAAKGERRGPAGAAWLLARHLWGGLTLAVVGLFYGVGLVLLLARSALRVLVAPPGRGRQAGSRR